MNSEKHKTSGKYPARCMWLLYVQIDSRGKNLVLLILFKAILVICYYGPINKAKLTENRCVF